MFLFFLFQKLFHKTCLLGLLQFAKLQNAIGKSKLSMAIVRNGSREIWIVYWLQDSLQMQSDMPHQDGHGKFCIAFVRSIYAHHSEIIQQTHEIVLLQYVIVMLEHWYSQASPEEFHFPHSCVILLLNININIENHK